MKKHKISWLNIPGYIPQTWNPIVGCTKVSPGCAHCYAERMAVRLSGMPKQSYKYSPVVEKGKWNGKIFFDPLSLNNPSGWEKPRAVFVCSMGDLFHEEIPWSKTIQVWDEMCCNPQHTYIVLTKRPEIALEFMRWLGRRTKKRGLDSIPTQSEDMLDYVQVPDFIWMGVTVENQEMADKRIPLLLSIPAKKRFLSCEPLLGPMKILKYLFPGADGFPEEMNRYHDWIDWVIVGGESGNKARHMEKNWAAELKWECEFACKPFFFKQLSATYPDYKDFDSFPDYLQIREFPE
jgi:protein gp37